MIVYRITYIDSTSNASSLGEDQFIRRKSVCYGFPFERKSQFGFCLSVRGGQHDEGWGESFPSKSETLKKHTFNHIPRSTWNGYVRDNTVMGSDHEADNLGVQEVPHPLISGLANEALRKEDKGHLIQFQSEESGSKKSVCYSNESQGSKPNVFYLSEQFEGQKSREWNNYADDEHANTDKQKIATNCQRGARLGLDALHMKRPPQGFPSPSRHHQISPDCNEYNNSATITSFRPDKRATQSHRHDYMRKSNASFVPRHRPSHFAKKRKSGLVPKRTKLYNPTVHRTPISSEKALLFREHLHGPPNTILNKTNSASQIVPEISRENRERSIHSKLNFDVSIRNDEERQTIPSPKDNSDEINREMGTRRKRSFVDAQKTLVRDSSSPLFSGVRLRPKRPILNSMSVSRFAENRATTSNRILNVERNLVVDAEDNRHDFKGGNERHSQQSRLYYPLCRLDYHHILNETNDVSLLHTISTSRLGLIKNIFSPRQYSQDSNQTRFIETETLSNLKGLSGFRSKVVGSRQDISRQGRKNRNRHKVAIELHFKDVLYYALFAAVVIIKILLKSLKIAAKILASIVGKHIQKSWSGRKRKVITKDPVSSKRVHRHYSAHLPLSIVCDGSLEREFTDILGTIRSLVNMTPRTSLEDAGKYISIRNTSLTPGTIACHEKPLKLVTANDVVSGTPHFDIPSDIFNVFRSPSQVNDVKRSLTRTRRIKPSETILSTKIFKGGERDLNDSEFEQLLLELSRDSEIEEDTIFTEFEHHIISQGEENPNLPEYSNDIPEMEDDIYDDFVEEYYSYDFDEYE